MEQIIKNRKVIITKMSVFFVMLFFLIFYSYIFTTENAVIGVLSIIIILMLFDQDLSDKPFKNILVLAAINGMLLLTSFLITVNFTLFLLMAMGLIFIINHRFLIDMNSRLYIPYLLMFVYLIMTPQNNLNDYLVRLSSLLVGPILLMIMQVINNKLYPISKMTVSIISLGAMLHDKIKLLLEGGNLRVINKRIAKLISELRNDLYQKKMNKDLSFKECTNYLSLVVAYEKISNIIESPHISKAMQNELLILIELVDGYLKNNIKPGRITKFVNGFVKEYQTKTVLRERVELFGSLGLLRDSLVSLNKSPNQGKEVLPFWLERLKLDKYLNTGSLNFSFAAKGSLMMAVLLLASNLTGFYGGYYLLLGFIVFFKPIYKFDFSQLIWVLIIIPITIILWFYNFDMIWLVIGLFLFMYLYFETTFKVFIVIAALLLGFMINPEVNFVYLLSAYVLGMITAIITNLYIMPYLVKDEKSELLVMFYEIINLMLQEIHYKIHNESSKENYYMQSLYTTTNLILEQIIYLDEKVQVKSASILSVRRHLCADIYELYLMIDKMSDQSLIMEDLDEVIKTNNYIELSNVRMDSSKTYTINDKLTIILLNNIIQELQITRMRR